MEFNKANLKAAFKVVTTSEIFFIEKRGIENDFLFMCPYWVFAISYEEAYRYAPYIIVRVMNYVDFEDGISYKFTKDNSRLGYKIEKQNSTWDIVRRIIAQAQETHNYTLADEIQIEFEGNKTVLYTRDKEIPANSYFTLLNTKYLPILKIEKGAKIYTGAPFQPIISIGEDSCFSSMVMPVRDIDNRFIGLIDAIVNDLR